jgi:hypothetical protein
MQQMDFRKILQRKFQSLPTGAAMIYAENAVDDFVPFAPGFDLRFQSIKRPSFGESYSNP